MRILVCLGLAALVAGSAQPRGANAQPSERKRTADAEKKYREALSAAKRGDCSQALPQFRAAYDVLAIDLILFDIAGCLAKEGAWEQALHHLRLLEAREPSMPNDLETAVESAIVTAEESLGDDLVLATYYRGYLADTEPRPPEREAGEYRKLAQERLDELTRQHPEWSKAPTTQGPKQRPELTQSDDPQLAAPLPPQRKKTKLWAGIALGGVGLGALGVGGYYGISKARTQKDRADECAAINCPELDALNEQGEIYNRRGYLWGGAGLIAAAAGTTLIVLHFRNRDAHETPVAVSLTPTGVLLSATF